MAKRYSPACRYVVAVDPGKTFGWSLWEKRKGVWHHVQWASAQGWPQWLRFLSDYPVHLVCEGTSFGPSAVHIQRCIGRFEGVLGTEAYTIRVQDWRQAVYTPSLVAKTKGAAAWKKAAVTRAKGMGWHHDWDAKDAHHAAEACLIGYGYTSGLIPPSKLM